MNLHLKVLFGLAVVVLGGGFWVYTMLEDNIRPQYLRVMEDGLVDQAFFLARLVENELPDQNPEKHMKPARLKVIMDDIRNSRIRARIYEWQKKYVYFRVYITNSKGIVQYDSDRGFAEGQNYKRWNDVYRALKGSYGARSSDGVDSQGRPYNAMFVAFPLYKNGRLVGALTLSKPKTSLTGWADRAQARLWRGVLFFSSVLFVLAWLLTQLLLQPIFRLTQYARDIALGRRVPPPPISRDEIGTLTQEFVAMKQSLWQRRDLEQYVTQLTHELKSPISAIQGAAELLEDPDMPPEPKQRFLSNIAEQAERMDDIVQRLLSLVSLEQQEELSNPTTVSVDGLLSRLQKRFLPLAEQKKIHLTTDRHELCEAHLVGDEFLLEQALVNLMQNSFNFTPSGGELSITVLEQHQTLADGSRRPVVCFRVVDSGSGVPSYALDRVLEKFYSLEHPDTGKKGTGLGLPFVKQVALLHGGDFSLQNREQKSGAVATFWLPKDKEG